MCTSVRVQIASGFESGMDWECSIDIYTLPGVKQIASGNVLFSPGSSAQCFLMTFRGGVGWMGGSLEGGDIWLRYS